MVPARVLSAVQSADLARAAVILIRGGIVALPFKGTYALVGDLEQPHVHGRIQAAKGRAAPTSAWPKSPCPNMRASWSTSMPRSHRAQDHAAVAGSARPGTDSAPAPAAADPAFRKRSERRHRPPAVGPSTRRCALSSNSSARSVARPVRGSANRAGQPASHHDPRGLAGALHRNRRHRRRRFRPPAAHRRQPASIVDLTGDRPRLHHRGSVPPAELQSALALHRFRPLQDDAVLLFQRTIVSAVRHAAGTTFTQARKTFSSTRLNPQSSPRRIDSPSRGVGGAPQKQEYGKSRRATGWRRAAHSSAPWRPLPSSVHAKLRAGFLMTALLLVAVAVLSVAILGTMAQQVSELTRLQQNLDRSRQMEYLVVAQSHYRAMALLTHDNPTWSSSPTPSPPSSPPGGAIEQRTSTRYARHRRPPARGERALPATSAQVLELELAGRDDEAMDLHLSLEHPVSHDVEAANGALFRPTPSRRWTPAARLYSS